MCSKQLFFGGFIEPSQEPLYNHLISVEIEAKWKVLHALIAYQHLLTNQVEPGDIAHPLALSAIATLLLRHRSESLAKH